MMRINLLEYLEETAGRLPDKTAFEDELISLSFSELLRLARGIGSFLLRQINGLTSDETDATNMKGSRGEPMAGYGVPWPPGQRRFEIPLTGQCGISAAMRAAPHGFNANEPVIVFMNRGPEAVAAFFGVMYSGNYYVPLDEEMPKHRVKLIIESLSACALICSRNTEKAARELGFDGEIFVYEDIAETEVNADWLKRIRRNAIDTDPAYVVFTSGSTGTPKGVVACHRSVIDYIENLSEILRVTEETVFGSQTPLYVDACLKELMCTVKDGAQTRFIPKNLFMFPVRLVEYLNQHEINTVCWVVSALTIITGLGALEAVKPQYLHTVAFGSEVFPPAQFKKIREALPRARFINLYGPTEATGMSCYYEIPADYDGNTIPIGRPFRNTRIMLFDGDKLITEPNEAGEICILGTCLTLGYYNDFNKTHGAYVQNPLNTAFPELMYRTGDLGQYNENGDIMYLSRMDYQIKHMGHRIELMELEAVACRFSGVSMACCVYDEAKGKIVLFYTGSASVADITAFLRDGLPRYMLPTRFVWLEQMPMTDNMKLDRQHLKNQITEVK